MDKIKNNVAAAWESVCLDLKKKLPGHAIHAWFDPIVAVGFHNKSFILEVPNQFFLEWIESHYKENLINSLQKVVKDKGASYKLVVEKKPQTIEFEHIQKVNKKERHIKSNFICRH